MDRRFLLLVLLSLCSASLVVGQEAITYDIRFPNAAHHEADITVTFRSLPAGVLELRMSRSSPGRYALHEFAKNVYDLTAVNGRGQPLAVQQASPHQWNVSGHNGTVRVRYRLFADRADGTYSGIDRTHAHLNAPATWLWARGSDTHPVEVRFHDLPAGWRVATQLIPSSDSLVWRARDFQYFMDSPIEVGPLVVRSWPVRSGAREATIRLAIHHEGTDAEVDRYVEMIKPTIAELAAVYGEYPPFDAGTYTFIADYLPHVNGDGMEHRNSTILASTGSLRTNAEGLLGTVSHEFNHAWNVERIRPRTLEPFDFEEANMTGELWLAEGFTSYYGPLAIRRAGMTDLSQYARSLSGTLHTVVNSPGRRFFGPRGMSQQAPFVDAAASIDRQNKANTFISYYTYGAATALGLDLTLRQRYPGVTLDHLMRELWVRHGRTEIPYTADDVREALGRVTGDAAFANDFWRRRIEGSEVFNYAELLAQAGIAVRKSRAGVAWMTDTPLSDEGGRVVMTDATLIGTPLYEAGLDRGDMIVMLGGDSVRTTADVTRILGARRSGDVLPVEWTSRGLTVRGTVALSESPRLEALLYEEAGLEVTDAMRRFRQEWLGAKR